MEQHIIAIDPGTSKIVAMIAKKETPGKVSILHTQKVDSENCIRRGWIYNVEAAAKKIGSIIDRLQTEYVRPKLQAPIERVYVGIGGQSLHTERYSIRKQVEGGTIKQALINQINEEIEQYKPELHEVLEILPAEYYVDGQLTPNPVGTTASVIEARYQLIVVSNPNLKKLIRMAVPENIEVEYVVTPLATAAAVLEPKEKDLGCVLVEFGAGVTTVSVYKNRMLRYLVTIPLGGLAITKDIRNLNVLEEEAESLKIEYGRAIVDTADTSKITIDKESSTPREIGLRKLNEIIEARVNEILENVIHQITESGYADSLGSGIVITGGTAMLRYLEDSFRNRVNKNLRFAYPMANDTSKPAGHSAVIGMISMAKKNSVEPTKMEPPKKEPDKKESTKRNSWIGGLFTNSENPVPETPASVPPVKKQPEPIKTHQPDKTQDNKPEKTKEKGGGFFGDIFNIIDKAATKVLSDADSESIDASNENDNNEKNK